MQNSSLFICLGGCLSVRSMDDVLDKLGLVSYYQVCIDHEDNVDLTG